MKRLVRIVSLVLVIAALVTVSSVFAAASTVPVVYGHPHRHLDGAFGSAVLRHHLPLQLEGVELMADWFVEAAHLRRWRRCSK